MEFQTLQTHFYFQDKCRHVKFSKKKCGTARGDKLSTSNFCASAARPRHLHNEFKNSFQGDGMDNSNKHS